MVSSRFRPTRVAKVNFPTGEAAWAEQRMVVLPAGLVRKSARRPLLAPLLPTDVGFFPRASGHWRERKAGAPQTIFIWCLAGEGWCELRGRRYAVGRGDLLVIPANAAHTYAAALHPWTIYWWHAVGASLPDFCGELGLPEGGVVRVGHDPYALELFQRTLATMEEGYSSLRLIQASQALGHLLGVLLGCVRREEQSAGGSRYFERIARSIAHARENLAQPVTVADLAAVAHMSVPYFHTLFRRQTGFSPMDYFIRLRMHRACQLLDRTDHAIGQVAAEVGYADPLYFSRVFREINDVSPREYRRRRKG